MKSDWGGEENDQSIELKKKETFRPETGPEMIPLDWETKLFFCHCILIRVPQ